MTNQVKTTSFMRIWMAKVAWLSLRGIPWSGKNTSRKALEGRWEISKNNMHFQNLFQLENCIGKILRHIFWPFLCSSSQQKKHAHMRNSCDSWSCYHPLPEVIQTRASANLQLSQNCFERHVYVQSLYFAWKQLRWLHTLHSTITPTGPAEDIQ